MAMDGPSLAPDGKHPNERGRGLDLLRLAYVKAPGGLMRWCSEKPEDPETSGAASHNFLEIETSDQVTICRYL